MHLIILISIFLPIDHVILIHRVFFCFLFTLRLGIAPVSSRRAARRHPTTLRRT
jgi:hypothetical protein